MTMMVVVPGQCDVSTMYDSYPRPGINTPWYPGEKKNILFPSCSYHNRRACAERH